MKKILYVDMDGVLCDIHKAFRDSDEALTFPQASLNFFLNMEEIPDSVSSVNILKEHFDVYILTAPSEKNPLSYMEKRLWVEQHLGFDMVSKLIISPNKSLLKGDYLIDDNIKGKGQDEFEGELLHFGSEKYKNWKDVLVGIL